MEFIFHKVCIACSGRKSFHHIPTHAQSTLALKQNFKTPTLCHCCVSLVFNIIFVSQNDVISNASHLNKEFLMVLLLIFMILQKKR